MPTIDELQDRYRAALHAMQSGVRAVIHLDEDHSGADPNTWSHSPKHLRVGINSAMIESAAIARVLLNKKIIGEEEYWQMLVEVAEEEKRKYEVELTERYGKPIALV